MRRLFAAAAIAGLALSSFPARGQRTELERRFVASAQARDFDTLRQLLDSPVKLVNGQEMSAAEFVELISRCRAMNAGGGIMGWVCPPGVGGNSRCWVLAGGMRESGGKIRLSGVGNPGAPLGDPDGCAEQR
ncbi:MAG TPA: hypothetical protein VEX35_05970 [Allosphingosinicella sp.]|nr:hypothetical protein [Allosphingosinicella sp.]